MVDFPEETSDVKASSPRNWAQRFVGEDRPAGVPTSAAFLRRIGEGNPGPRGSWLGRHTKKTSK